MDNFGTKYVSYKGHKLAFTEDPKERLLKFLGISQYLDEYMADPKNRGTPLYNFRMQHYEYLQSEWYDWTQKERAYELLRKLLPFWKHDNYMIGRAYAVNKYTHEIYHGTTEEVSQTQAFELEKELQEIEDMMKSSKNETNPQKKELWELKLEALDETGAMRDFISGKNSTRPDLYQIGLLKEKSRIPEPDYRLKVKIEDGTEETVEDADELEAADLWIEEIAKENEWTIWKWWDKAKAFIIELLS